MAYGAVGRTPIGPDKRAEVLSLPAGVSGRAVAALLGISEAAVRNIRRQRAAEVCVTLPGDIPAVLEPGETIVAPPRRCRACGFLLAIIPCRICRARRFPANPPRPKTIRAITRAGRQWPASIFPASRASRMKITAAILERVVTELDKGELSQRAIARVVGISRGTVNNIAAGKMPRLREPQDDGMPDFAGPLVRCPGCGGKVYLPCLLCQIREAKTRERHQSARSPLAPRVMFPGQSLQRQGHW